MKMYLIRHGETTGDEEDRFGGDYDDCLSKAGEEQVKELVNKLKDKDIEIVYHSSLQRATQTAQAIEQELKIKIEELSDIRERNNYGELTGLTRKEAEEKFPEELEELQGNPIYHKLPHSEEYYGFAKRVINAFNQVSETEYETIAIVTHGGPIKAIFRELLGFEIEGLCDCAIIEIEKDGHAFEIVGMDGVEGITPN
jgi:broad specificity phosphatase PhoE